MLNDAACFKAVYIVCGYTDLRSGMDRLAALIEAQTGNRPYVPDTLYLFCAPSAEQKKSSFLEWIKLKMILYDPRQAVYPKAEIRIAVCQVNAAV